MTDKTTKREDPRAPLREARQRRMRLIAGGAPKAVKVWPADENMRMFLRHPTNRIRFRETLDQSVEWPNDSFTKRRIADGSVRIDGPAPEGHEAAPVDESLNPRQQSAARKAEAAAQAAKDAKSPAKPPPPQPPQPPQPHAR